VLLDRKVKCQNNFNAFDIRAEEFVQVEEKYQTQKQTISTAKEGEMRFHERVIDTIRVSRKVDKRFKRSGDSF
jgi:hypothetical protein